ncbi:response regulator transcription factor [Aggregatimonas sangjinii]|uniref:Response regulator transcription factor n=1 Tax=Aggregatimonas sangjinii TaxID=2583587 RepID=A0A5B7STN7_9FLAO|nr:LytTR family DNA-binding domain-containing protein [Aggregatimonas sangjinii]QCX00230.1 response regulator transcription factor [Aggregatimonas sangjinii]
MQYTYLIIDSETTSCLELQDYLEEYPEFVAKGHCLDEKEGINGILKHEPDIVFINLDKNAKEHFGMVTELHRYIQTLPILIGISQTQEQAYMAIKNNFFDYWLMPSTELEVRKSLLKLKRRNSRNEEPLKLCLKSYRDYHYVNTEDILYLKADNNATDVFMADGTKINAYKSLKKFEQQLPDNFVRVHQSYILNTKHVARINYGKAICSLTGQNLQLPFSKTYKENIDCLKSRLSKNSIVSLN